MARLARWPLIQPIRDEMAANPGINRHFAGLTHMTCVTHIYDILLKTYPVETGSYSGNCTMDSKMVATYILMQQGKYLFPPDNR